MEEEVDEFGIPIKKASAEVDEFGIPVKKKPELGKLAWDASRLQSGVSSQTQPGTESKSVSAPTAEQTLGYTPQSASVNDKDLQVYDEWMARNKPAPEENPIGKINPDEYRAMGYGEEQIKMLLDEEKRALRDDPNFYKKVADEDQGQQSSDRALADDKSIGFLKLWAAKNGQTDRINRLIQKAHSEVKKDTPDEIASYEQAVWENGPNFVPLHTPTGLQIYEEARNVQSSVLNKAYKRVVQNPQTKDKLEQISSIYETLKDSTPMTEEDKIEYNNLVQQHEQLRNDPEVQKALDITKQFDELHQAEKDLYVKFPDAYKKRSEDLNRQVAIDAMFKTGVSPSPGIAGSYTYGLTSQFGRALTEFGGSILKIPKMADTDNQYTGIDKWADMVDRMVDGINEDVFQIPSSWDADKTGMIRNFAESNMSKKIEELPEDEQDDAKEEMAARLDKIGTGELTYLDSKGNRVWRKDLIVPKLARTAADMATLLGGASAAGAGIRMLDAAKIADGAGLVMSSYVQSYDGYRKAGEAAGLNPDQAAMFAHSSSALTSALELISPNKYLWSKGEIAERVAKGIASGQGMKAATKDAFKFFGKEVLGENIQEFSQLAGDKIVETIANKSIGRPVFELDPEKLKNEAFETAVLTTLVTGLPAGAKGVTDVRNRSRLYSDAVQIVAEDKDKYMPMLQMELKKANVSPEMAKRVVDDVNAVVLPDGKPMYKINGVEVEKEDLENHIEAGGDNNVYIANDPEMEQMAKGFKPKATGVAFFSPSEREGSTLEHAQAGLKSAEHKALGKASKQLAKELGIVSNVQPAIGTWEDGADESFIEEVSDPSKDREKLRYMAAVRGVAANQKQVLTFTPSENGPDVLHTFTVQDDVEKVKQNLDDAGLIYSTLAPTKEGTRVVLLDQGGENAQAAKAFAEEYDVPIRSQQGEGEFLGGETRDAGRAAMEEVISSYENANPERKGLAAKIIDGYRNDIASAKKKDVKAQGQAVPSSSEQGQKVAENAPIPGQAAGQDVTNGTAQDVTNLPEGTIEGVDLKAAERVAKDPGLKRHYKVLQKVKSALKKIAPGVKVVFYRDDESGKRLIEHLGGSVQNAPNGFYDPKSKTLAINLAESQSNTPFHEGIHPIINALKESNPDLFAKFADEAAAMEHPDGGTYGDVMGDNEEALVEFLADVADGQFDKNQGLLKRVENFIRKMLDAIGLGSVKLDASNLKDFASQLADAIAAGRTIDMTDSQSGGMQFQEREKMPKTKERLARKGYQYHEGSNVFTDPDGYVIDEENALDYVNDGEDSYDNPLTDLPEVDIRDMIKILTGSPDGKLQFQNKKFGASGTTGKEPIRPATSQSTRVPTSKSPDKWVGNPLGDSPLRVSLEDQRKTPASYVKNSILAASYPALQGKYDKAAKKMSERVTGTDSKVLAEDIEMADKIFADLKNIIVDNLLWLHDKFPEKLRGVAKLWYDGANRLANQMASNYGITTEQASGVFAVLSPQKDWYMNVSLGERVTDIFHNHQNTPITDDLIDRVMTQATSMKNVTNMDPARFEKAKQDAIDRAKRFAAEKGTAFKDIVDPRNKAVFVRAFDEINNTRKYNIIHPDGTKGGMYQSNDGEGDVAWGTYGSIAKAISILEDGSKENISAQIGGEHKVRNFYNNIANPNSPLGEVTVDTHAVAAGLLKPLSGNAPEVVQAFGGLGTSSSSQSGISGLYPLFADAYREAAAKRGILAREMQSITWEAGRRLFTSAFKSNAKNVSLVRGLWDQFKNKKTTLDELRRNIEQATNPVWEPDWHRPDSEEPAGSEASANPAELSGVSGRTGAAAAERTEPGGDGTAAPVVPRSPKGVRIQTQQRRKLNRTAKRIAGDAFTELRRLRSDINANPDNYKYDTQSITDKKADLANMTMEQAIAASSIDELRDNLKAGDEFAVLSAIDLIKRYNEAGMDTRPIFKTLREVGTSIGQFLRQFAELKTTGEGMVNFILKYLNSYGLTTTQEQTNTLLGFAKSVETSRTARDNARVNFLADSTDANKALLDEANKQLSEAINAWGKYVGVLVPMGPDKMLTTILQGNLLVPTSTIANVVGNVTNVTKYPEKTIGTLAAYIYQRLWRKNPVSAAEMFWGSGFNSTGVFFGSVPKAFVNAVTGKLEDGDNKYLDAKRNLRPLDTLVQMLTKEGRASMPIGIKELEKAKQELYEQRGGYKTFGSYSNFVAGMTDADLNEAEKMAGTPLWVWAEKAVESTLGANAELMFRTLYVGDQPFRNSARLSAQWTVFAENGGKAKYGSFDRFLNSMSAQDVKRVEQMTNESTFSEDDGWLYRPVQNVINAMARTPGLAGMPGVMSSIIKVLGKTAMPYVKIPANLIQRTIEYAIPAIPFGRGLKAMKEGNPRLAGEMFTRAAIGIALDSLLMSMYASGVIIAGASDDDKATRALKYEEKPNGINIDAMKRFVSGTQDPANPRKEGDRIWDFTKFGVIGIVAAVIANEEQKREKTGASLVSPDGAMSFFDGVVSGSLEMSFMQGALNISEAFSRDGIGGVASEMASSGSAIFLPNNFMMFTKARAPYILHAKDEELLGKFKEKMLVKMFPTLNNSETGVYPIISMFGDPVKQTPDDNNPWVYNFFNITKDKQLKDPMTVDIMNLYSRLDEVPAIKAPSEQVKLNVDDEETPFTLDEGDYTYAQILAGRYKRFEINLAMQDQELGWSALSDQEKHEILGEINDRANDQASEFLQARLQDDLEAGRVVIQDGKYKYVNRPAFDLGLYEKNKDILEQ